MNKILASLLLSILTATSVNAADAPERSAEDYTLSMAGALINDHCGRSWQYGEYVNLHACNYQLANLYTLGIASAHFDECTVRARGDIVMIADCMVTRFNAWLDEAQPVNN